MSSVHNIRVRNITRFPQKCGEGDSSFIQRCQTQMAMETLVAQRELREGTKECMMAFLHHIRGIALA